MSLTFQLCFVPFQKKKKKKKRHHLAWDSFWISGEVVFLTKSLVAKKLGVCRLLLVWDISSRIYPLLSTWSGFAVAFAIGSLLESLLVDIFTKHTCKLILVVISLLCSTFCCFCVCKFLPYFGSEKHYFPMFIYLCGYPLIQMLNFYLCLWNQTVKIATPVF